jgi:hypothetical protein
MSEFARLTGVFFSPGAAFADIAKRPRWWVPILVLGVLGIVSTYIFSQQVGFEIAIRAAMDRSPQALQIPPQQREQMINLQVGVAKYAAYGTVVFLTIAYALIAAVLKFLFDVILGADIGFKRMLAIVSYSSLPNFLVTILSIAVFFMKAPEDIDLQNPLAFNLAAYLPDDSPGWLRGFGATMDLFSFWIIGLLGIGVSRASRKISTAKAIVTILFPWSLWVLLRTALGMLQGG